MNKAVKDLVYIDTHDSLMRVLQSWRLWVAGALAGALIAAGVFAVFPPPYRARAVVVVDLNIEDVYDIPPERQFYFIGRETRKLQALAWSDETIQLVADQVGGVSVRELRDETLTLSQPEDGSWYFFADHKDAGRAEEIAGAWAKTFYQQVLDGVEISEYLVVMREEIPKIFEQYQGINGGEASYLVEKMYPQMADSKGISPYTEVSLSQVDQLQVVRKVPMSVYILAGALIGACGLALAALSILRAEEQDVFLAD
ncbi:MAG: hypothetical protein JW757_05595 [Anaerolineales bacterium]|nr:hypothetical protein [Anaerolineales bacterium]